MNSCRFSLELVHTRKISSMYLFQSLGAGDAWDSQLFLMTRSLDLFPKRTLKA